MQETTNIGLKTYEASDPTDWLADFNYNMNKIDESVGAQNASIATVTSTANQANSTATLANTTANSALSTANSKASIDDLASSDSTTYSSEKIDELIAGAGGAVIDDTTTSLNSTWSSSKINTEISSKTSINDSTASATTTYSSNKIDELLSYGNYQTYYDPIANEASNYNYDEDININDDGFYIIQSVVKAKVSDSSTTYPAKLFTNGICDIKLKRDNQTYTIAEESKLTSIDFTNVTNHTIVNNVNNMIFKNNVSLFLKAGDIINIKNTQGSTDKAQTWKFTNNVKIIRIY